MHRRKFLDLGYDLYSLSYSNHKKFMPKHLGYKWGLCRFQYFINEDLNRGAVLQYYNPFFVYFWAILMVIPSFIWYGVKHTMESISEIKPLASNDENYVYNVKSFSGDDITFIKENGKLIEKGTKNV